MVLALIASLLAAAPPPSDAAAVRNDDPPVKIWLDQDGYFIRGDKARVHVRLADDGYLVVLRADTDGRVRVLFPLDPVDDAFVRSGRKIEIRGRGDREAFYVDDRDGSGVVLAARSAAPFRFDEFVRGDHWDYRVLTARDAEDDKEQALLDIAQRMVPDGRFDYDVVSYTVSAPRAYYDRWHHPYDSPVSVHLSFGYRYGHRYCDPYWYDPFFCGSYYDPFFYGYRPYYYDPFFYTPYVYRPYIYRRGTVIYTRKRYGGGLFIDRVRPGEGSGFRFRQRTAAAPTVMGVGPRLRVPQGTLLSRATERRVPASATTSSPARVRDAARGSHSVPVWSRGASPERRQPEAREARAPERRQPEAREARAPERRRPERTVARPAPERRQSGGGAARPAPSGGSRSSSAGAARPSGSSGSGKSAPSNGGGRRKP
ncbi:MAG TPA: DUF4384 domain-containing protein [Gemmatimonadales bacterium]|nr:DUF4384 domain-containing protein [Gemmatimonadales bacterium]